MNHRPSASGRIYVWQTGSLWIGRSQGRIDWHSHHAIQVAIGLGGTVRLRSRDDAAAIAFAGAIIPSQREHQFESGDGMVANVFVEPETVVGRALTARYARGIERLPESEQRASEQLFQDALAAGSTREGLVKAARDAVDLLAGTTAPAQAVDPRILKAIEFIRDHLDAPLSLESVAAVATLSPSRFRHLFVQETGASFRAYVLWTRLNAGLVTVMAGRSWTEAAHEAGFTDSSHLNRTFNRMFGLNPSAVFPDDWGKVAT